MPSAAPAKGRLRGPPVDPVDESSDSDFDAASPAAEGRGERPDSESGSESDAGSSSDSLDSSSPRKRRRTSPAPDHEDAEPKIIKSAFNVPSRIKRSKPQGENKAEPARPEPKPTPGVTAPTDANTTFDSLGVRPWLVQSLANMAIRRPTAIQRESIPMLLKGRDCIGGSRTGSGKTVAFAVPILQKWAENPSAIFALILTPTR